MRKGLSLVEALIASVVFLSMAVLIAGFMLQGRRTLTYSANRLRAASLARAALERALRGQAAYIDDLGAVPNRHVYRCAGTVAQIGKKRVRDLRELQPCQISPAQLEGRRSDPVLSGFLIPDQEAQMFERVGKSESSRPRQIEFFRQTESSNSCFPLT